MILIALKIIYILSSIDRLFRCIKTLRICIYIYIFDPSLKRPACLVIEKSCDTTKQSVCGWQYIYIYIYINTNPCIVLFTAMFIHKNTHTYIYIYIYIYIYMCVCVCVCVYVCVWARESICLFFFFCRGIWQNSMHTYRRTHTHTHIL